MITAHDCFTQSCFGPNFHEETISSRIIPARFCNGTSGILACIGDCIISSYTDVGRVKPEDNNVGSFVRKLQSSHREGEAVHVHARGRCHIKRLTVVDSG